MVFVNEYEKPMYQEPDNGNSSLVKLHSPSPENTNKIIKKITVDVKPGVLITSDSAADLGYSGIEEDAEHRVAYWIDPKTSLHEITFLERNDTNWTTFDTAMTSIQVKK
jgi:hypothetical protein